MPAKFKVSDSVTSEYYGFTGTIVEVHELKTSRWKADIEGEDFEYDVTGLYDKVSLNQHGARTQTFFEKWLERSKVNE